MQDLLCSLKMLFFIFLRRVHLIIQTRRVWNKAIKNILCVMKNSSSREFECERKTLFRSRNHHVPTRLFERGETRHAHYRRAIYRESRCGNIAMRRRLGDPVHEWERGRAWLSTPWCIARRVYETQARARKISVVSELSIAPSDKRVAIETHYFSSSPFSSSFSSSLFLFFFANCQAFLPENINISRSC